jgi:hypothetical protein
MDADRFDALSRSLAAVGTRRRALVTALVSALSALGLADPDEVSAAKSPKCKRKPGECERCDRGTCTRKNGEKRCKAGKIKPKAFGTPCSVGSCQNGACIAAAAAAPALPCGGCPSGQRCLANGSCAIICGLGEPDCPSSCNACSGETTEGQHHCIHNVVDCGPLETCIDTSECPRGTHCQGCSMGQSCVPLCTG